MEAIETIEKYNLTGMIFVDTDAENPRNWDNTFKMVCCHNRYSLGDKHDYDHNDYENWQDFKKQLLQDFGKDCLIEPLSLYDHSGLSIRIGTASGWDCGQVGFIVASRESLRQNYGVKRLTKKYLERSLELMESEVKVYDNYVSGEVFCFEICDEDGEVLESCSGHYGLNDALDELEDFMKSYKP